MKLIEAKEVVEYKAPQQGALMMLVPAIRVILKNQLVAQHNQSFILETIHQKQMPPQITPINNAVSPSPNIFFATSKAPI